MGHMLVRQVPSGRAGLSVVGRGSRPMVLRRHALQRCERRTSKAANSKLALGLGLGIRACACPRRYINEHSSRACSVPPEHMALARGNPRGKPSGCGETPQ